MQQNLVSKPTPYTNLELLQDKIFREFFSQRIGIIEAYDPETNTATISIVDVESKIVDVNNVINQNFPPLPNVPIFRYATQNAGFTKPILVGDTVILLFNDTNIDNFLENPSIQPPFNDIRHDLNNAVAIPYDFSVWQHNNEGAEMFYGNMKISLSANNIIITTQNSQQIVLDPDGNITIPGTATITGAVTIDATDLILGGVPLSTSSGKLTVGGKEVAVVGGTTVGSPETQTITVSGQ